MLEIILISIWMNATSELLIYDFILTFARSCAS